MKKKVLCLILALVLCISLLPTMALAGATKTIYVDAASTAAEPNGAEATPYKTIQAAVNAASDGDTILVKSGNYNVWCPKTSADNYTGRDHNLFIGKNITVKGEDNVNIYSLQSTYQYAFDRLITVIISGSHGVVLDNLNIFPVYYSAEVSGLPTVTESVLNTITGSSTLYVYYNQIIDTLMNYNSGKPTSETTIENVTIKNCTIGDKNLDADEWGSAIYFNGYVNNTANGISGGYLVENNTFYGSVCICEDGGWNATNLEQSCIIRNNIFYDTIMLNGNRPTGWNYKSVTVKPTITGNTFNAVNWSIEDDGFVYNYCIGARDAADNKVFTQAELQTIIANNTFAGDLVGKTIGSAIGRYKYSNPDDEAYSIIFAAFPVASITKGEPAVTTKYFTLQAAVNAAKTAGTSGQVITVFGETAGANLNGIPENLTIQGTQGNKITSDFGTDGTGISLKGLKLKNLNIVGAKITFSNNVSDYSGLTIEGCTMDGTGAGTSNPSAITLGIGTAPYDGILIKGNTISNYMANVSTNAIVVNNSASNTNAGTVTIEGNTVTNFYRNAVQLVFAPADIIIKDNKFTRSNSMDVLDLNSAKSVSVTGNTFTVPVDYSTDNLVVKNSNAGALVDVTGNTIIKGTTTLTAIADLAPHIAGYGTNNTFVGTNITKDATEKITGGYLYVYGTPTSFPTDLLAEYYIPALKDTYSGISVYEIIKQAVKVEEVENSKVHTQEGATPEEQTEAKKEVEKIANNTEVITMTKEETKVEQAVEQTTKTEAAGQVEPTINGTPIAENDGKFAYESNKTLTDIVNKIIDDKVNTSTEADVTDTDITKFVKVAVDGAAVKTEKTTGSSVTVSATVESVTYNVKPMATTTVTVNQGTAQETTTTVTTPIPNELITAPITFRLGVPDQFTGIVKVTHKHSDGTKEEFNTTVLGTAPNKYVELSSDNFSEWTVTMGSTTVVADEVKMLDTTGMTATQSMTIKKGGTLLLKGDQMDKVAVTPSEGVLVTFNYDGGADANGALKMYTVITAGTLVTPPVLQSKTANSKTYYFSGWDSTKNPVGEKIWEDTTFTAQWTEQESYTVTLTSDAPEVDNVKTIKVGGGTNVTVAVNGANWSTAKIIVNYDKDAFTLSDTHDSAIVNDATNGKATITLYGADRVNGEVCKTLTFVAKAVTTPTTDNFTVDTADSTVNTGTSAMVINASPVSTANNAKVKVIAADAAVYTITLGTGLSYTTDPAVTTVVTGSSFTGKIDNYDKGYTYSFVDGNNAAITGATANADGTFTIPAASITGDLTVKVSKGITGITAGNVKVIADFVGGYSLVLVDATAATQLSNLAFNGAVMFRADKYVAQFSTTATAVYAYIVKGTITPTDAYAQLSLSKAAQIVLPKAESTTDQAARDVNNSGNFDLNDVQAVWNCYNVNQSKYPMATYMAVYLRADVNASGKVDAKDVSDIFGVYKAPTTLLTLGNPS